MLQKTEGAMKYGQSRETGNIRYTRHVQDEDEQTNKKQQKTTQYELDTTM